MFFDNLFWLAILKFFYQQPTEGKQMEEGKKGNGKSEQVAVMTAFFSKMHNLFVPYLKCLGCTKYARLKECPKVTNLNDLIAKAVATGKGTVIDFPRTHQPPTKPN